MEFVEDPHLPIVSTLHYVTHLLNVSVGFSDPQEFLRDPNPQISEFETRVELAEDEMIPFMADSLVRDSLSRIETFVSRYDEILDSYALSLV